MQAGFTTLIVGDGPLWRVAVHSFLSPHDSFLPGEDMVCVTPRPSCLSSAPSVTVWSSASNGKVSFPLLCHGLPMLNARSRAPKAHPCCLMHNRRSA